MLSTFAVHLLRNRAANLPDLGIDPAAIRSILFVELTRLGDVISAFTAVDSLRSHFPQARSAMMVCDRYEELVRVALPGIDVIGIRNVPPFVGEIRGVTGARRRAADLLLSLGPGRRNGLVALLSGSPRIAGYLECVAGSVPFLRENSVEGWGFRPAALEVKYGNEPHALRALKVCRLLGVPEVHSPLPLRIGSNVAFRKREQLLRASVPMEGRYFVVHPFAGWIHRRWPLDAFAGFLPEAVRLTGAKGVVIGGSADVGGMKTLRNLVGTNASITYHCSEDIVETAVLMHGAVFFVGNDSGPLHLASAVGVPSVGLFGPASPGLTRPAATEGWRLISLYHQVHCSPCLQVTCPGDERLCMKGISRRQVLDAVAEITSTQADSRKPAYA